MFVMVQLLMWVVICFNFDGIRNVLLNHIEKLCMGPVYKREISLAIQQCSTWQCYNSMEVNIQHLVFETAMEEEAILKSVAVTAILHTPTLILHLPSTASWSDASFAPPFPPFSLSLSPHGFFILGWFSDLEWFLILGWWLGLRERSG